MKNLKNTFTSLALFTAGSTAVFAHHPHEIYTATPAPFEDDMRFYIGLAESFTHFGTIQVDGAKTLNEIDQRLESSITQAIAGYRVTERFTLQASVPIVTRYFKRPAESRIEHGTESGLGDVSLSGHFLAWEQNSGALIVRWHLLGGVKFPTGSTSRLAEEAEEGHGHSDKIHGDGHDHSDLPESGIHGHDLTLGTGSIDGIIGTAFYLGWQRVFFAAEAQYGIRTEGDFDYRFANELTWSGGPGVYLAKEKNFSVGLQANISGEHKGRDRLSGENVEDTASTLFTRVRTCTLSWREQLRVEIGGDIPVSIDNTALQIVPDYRVRAAVTWWF